MPIGALQAIRLAWFLALGVMLSSFRDALGLTLAASGGRYLRTATRERVILGLIEGLLLIAAVTVATLLRGGDSLAGILSGAGPGAPHGWLDSATGLPDRTPGTAAASPAGVSSALPVALAIVGALVAFAGSALASIAKRTLGSRFTVNLGVKEDHELITSGPYALVRHPIYLGIILFTLGTGLVFDRGTLLLLGVALAPCFVAQARIEEQLFAGHFGAAYEAYRSRVPAVIPWPRPR